MRNLIVIDKPIFLLRIKGNYEDTMSESGRTVICSFEAHTNETLVVCLAENSQSTDTLKYFRSIDKNIKKKDVSIEYSQNGINFVTLK